MSINDETADILGGKIFPSPQPKSGLWSSLSFNVKSFLALAVILVTYIASVHVWRLVLKWKEKSYRLSVRRKHGIPDNDRRPFNVAYAAVMRARREQEKNNNAGNKATAPPAPATHRLAAADAQLHPASRPTASDQQRLYPSYVLPVDLTSTARQRPVPSRHMDSSWSVTAGIPGRYHSEGLSSALSTGRPRTVSSNTATSSDRYNGRGASIGYAELDRSPAKRLGETHPLREVNGEDQIDELPEDQGIAMRGSKRGLDEEEYQDEYYYYDDGDEVAGPSKRKRDKRARKISLEKRPNGQVPNGDVDEEDDGDMVVDDDEEGEDEMTDLRVIKPGVRGKKRDRAEAGSTFGGDDEDSAPEEETNTITSRRRKRRTFSKRKSDAALSRGQKRDRGDTDEEEDEESDDVQEKRVSRKKRGKRGSHVHELTDRDRYDGGSGSDVSMDGSNVSSHPSCKGRKIGEEWTSHGVGYKVGPNGERLRRVLVKQATNKFVMPADSQHPDRDANMEIWVAEWLTDEEYKAAKAQQLTTPVSTSSSAEPETPKPEDEKPIAPLAPPTGKNLLWQAPVTPSQRRYSSQFRDYDSNSASRDPFRQSVATNVGLRVNPFQQQSQLSSLPSSRRVASPATRIASPGQRPLINHSLISHSPNGSASPVSAVSFASSIAAGSLADSTNNIMARGSPRRGFSKWEKQDLEAAAMRKVREANKKKEEEKEKERREKEEKEKATRAATAATAATTAPSSLAAPTINIIPPTAPSTTTASSSSMAPTLNFGKPAEDKGAAANTTTAKPPSSLGFGFPPATAGVASSSAPAETSMATAPPVPSLGLAPPLGSMTEAGKGNAAAPPANPFGTPSTTTPSFPFGKATAPATNTPAAQPSTNPSGTGIPNFFAKPATDASTASKPATEAPATTPSAAPKFGFGTPTTAPGGGSTTASSPFTWAAPPAQNATSSIPSTFDAKKSDNSAGQASSNTSGPLLNRLGGAQPSSTAPGSAAASGEAPKFSFAKPNATTQSTSVFGNASTAANTGSTTQPSPIFGGPSAPVNTNAAGSTAGATTTPKFNFGFGGKSASSTPTPAPVTATTSGDATKSAVPSPSAFGFGPPKPASTTTTTETKPDIELPQASVNSQPNFNLGFNAKAGAASKGVQPSTFGFGVTSSSSPFGSGATSSTPANPFGTASPATEAPKSTFSDFGAVGSSKPSAFSSTTPAGSPAPFTFGGGATGGSAFGSANSATGTGSNSTQGAQSAFSFGGSSTPATASDAPKPAFSFGNSSTAPNAPATNNATPQTSKPVFSFGPSATTPNASTGAAKAAFPFGGASSSTLPASAPAASAPTPASAPAPGGSSGFTFNFGAASKPAANPSPFGTGTTSSTPQSVFGNNGKPANNNAFSFGGSSNTAASGTGAFSFGTPSTPNGKQ